MFFLNLNFKWTLRIFGHAIFVFRVEVIQVLTSLRSSKHIAFLKTKNLIIFLK